GLDGRDAPAGRPPRRDRALPRPRARARRPAGERRLRRGEAAARRGDRARRRVPRLGLPPERAAGSATVGLEPPVVMSPPPPPASPAPRRARSAQKPGDGALAALRRAEWRYNPDADEMNVLLPGWEGRPGRAVLVDDDFYVRLDAETG